MELNWTTFFLEIINFLVLVWLLKHFLYVPVKGVIARRREGIEQQLAEADRTQQQAEVLLGKYENRLDDWEKERQEARQRLQREIDADRVRMLDELRQELDAEREKNAVLAEREIAEHRRECEIKALEMGGRFVSRLLEGVASEQLEAHLIELLLDELQSLPPEQHEALQVKGNRALTIEVASAFPLHEAQKKKLQQRFEKLISGTPAFEWREDRKLIAGVRITVGPWVIHANLNDELRAFSSLAHEQ